MLDILTQDRAARLLVLAMREAEVLRANATRKETALHKVADAHLAKLTVAIRYAFARGRKALGKNKNAGAAVKAIKAALLDVLPATLETVVAASGRAATKLLPKMKAAAGFNPDEARDEKGQWTSGGGVAFHGSSEANLESILKHGIRPSKAGRSEVAEAWISTDKQEAQSYARGTGKNGVVLEVHVPASDVGRFKNSLGAGPVHYSTETIPASWIKAVYQRDGTYDKRGLDKWVKIRSLAASETFVLFVVVNLGNNNDDKLRVAAKVFDFTFDAGDPNVAKWAREHAAELAKGISETTRERIAEAIANQAETGEDSYDEILAVVGDDARAELIARTETMAAANEGQRQSWDQAVDNGLLDETTKRVWIATGDACSECEALDGEEAALDGAYPDDGGDGPPLHPNCRCTEGIVS